MGARTSTVCREMPAVGAGQPQPHDENGPGPKMKNSTLKRPGKYINCKNKVGDALVPPVSLADTALKDTGDSRYVIPFIRDLYTWSQGNWPCGGSLKIDYWTAAITGGHGDPSWDTVYMLQRLVNFQDTAKYHQPPNVKDHSNKTLTAETPTTLGTALPPYAPQYPKLPLLAPEPDLLLNEVAAFVTRLAAGYSSH
ncbi:hypothetical protein chiPu_0014195 [Chiloscyllium punctatum]|uniref:Uncharacterized protein n=1 Tax=Chiloscyllium punctatum TaxID=137246 RepID=A0A401SZ71_CHIPU|nr:hypothetical protein [Chiloscyllium punctatum]